MPHVFYGRLSSRRAEVWAFVVVCSILFTRQQNVSPGFRNTPRLFLIGKTEKFRESRNRLWCYVVKCLQEITDGYARRTSKRNG
jgi:hypothetical protein